MAMANSLDWSLAAAITSTNRKSPQFQHNFHSTTKTKNPFPFFLPIFFNSSPQAVRADPSACSPPLMEDDAPIIELALNPHDFPDHLPQDCKQLNALICNLFKDPQTEHLAYDHYSKAREENPDFIPHKHTMKLVIRYLLSSKNWASLFSLICEDIKEFRVLPDKPTCCRLISTCVKARKLKIVNSFLEVVLDNDVEIAVAAFDCAMKGYNQLHMYSTTTVLYQSMKSANLDLDPACYSHIMEAYLKMRQFDKAIAIFQEFEKMIQIDQPLSPIYPKIYWILCESLGKQGRPLEALDYFRQMSTKGIPVDHSLYSSLISSLASSGEVKMAEELFQEAESKKMLRDPALFLKLVLRYVEEGLMEKTLDIVSSMKRANLRVSDCIFCAIVNGFSKKNGVRAAVTVYEDLVSQGCDPGQVTYASVLNMYCRLGLYPKAEMVFQEMENKGYHNCVVAYSSMIAAYGKTGRIKDALRLVAKMKERGCEPNVWTYNALLDMNGRALNLRLVEKTWKEMKRRKILPDRVSYTTVIGAYNRAKEFDTCMKYYEEFKQTGGKIDRAMAGIMVAVFSKTNRVDELVELMRDMKVQGTKLDERIYRTAMTALRDSGLQGQSRWLQETFKYT